MIRPDLDWAYVRRHTLVPSLCALVSMVAMCVAFWLHGNQQQLFTALRASHDAVDQDYNALVKQRRLVDRYHRHYRRFHELGFIGRESRLDWVETLRTTSTELSMPRLSYSIDPQRRAIAPVSSLLGGENFQIRVSQLQLEMSLVHEIDLLRFFDELQRKAPGLLKVDECALDYIGDPQSSVDENLTARCAVQIFSLITSDVTGGVM